jgi:hypothetical protein
MPASEVFKNGRGKSFFVVAYIVGALGVTPLFILIFAYLGLGGMRNLCAIAKHSLHC